MLCMAYWYLGNRQIFNNKYLPLERANGEQMDPQHYLFDWSDGVDGPLLILLSIPCIIFHSWIIKKVSSFYGCIGVLRNLEKLRKLQEDDINIDEALGHYSECLSGIDQKRWYCQEQYNRKYLGIETMDHEQLYLLQTCKRQDRLMMNIPNYDIMSNIRYCDSFNFTQLDRRFENSSSDFVSQIIQVGEDRHFFFSEEERMDHKDLLKKGFTNYVMDAFKTGEERHKAKHNDKHSMPMPGQPGTGPVAICDSFGTDDSHSHHHEDSFEHPDIVMEK